MLENKINTEQDKVLFELSPQGVAQVILNNPEKHNAFDDNIISQLKNLFLDIAKRDDIKIVVLSSKGKNFSAGADLGWMKRMASYSYEDNVKDASELAKMLHALNFLPQTTIAQIQGAAFGGAVGLASCCDIVIASDKASFCLSEVKLGLIPATISPYVVQAMGVKACRRYFQTAERFYAQKALSLGLVDEVVESHLLTMKVDEMVSTLLLNSPAAMKAAKQLIVDVAHKEINDHLLTQTSEQIASIRVSKEGQEGLTAFFEKRKPSWQIDS
ncbi:MAG: enoyl-CoA hydratase/isomerase family protein [Colwellia sp.]